MPATKKANSVLIVATATNFRLPKSRKHLRMLALYRGPKGSIVMRSSWEVNFAQWLDAQKIQWLYEPQAFKLGRATYCPDFLLIKSHVWIEIKGRLTQRAKIKLRKFSVMFPQERLYMLRGPELKELGVKLGKGAING